MKTGAKAATHLHGLVEERHAAAGVLLDAQDLLKRVNLAGMRASRSASSLASALQGRRERTLTQHDAMSSMRPSIRLQSALAHCCWALAEGCAVRLLYELVVVGGGSGARRRREHGRQRRGLVASEANGRRADAAPLKPASRARDARSNVLRIRPSTASVRSPRSVLTSSGSMPRLNAVCSADASTCWFCEGAGRGRGGNVQRTPTERARRSEMGHARASRDPQRSGPPSGRSSAP